MNIMQVVGALVLAVLAFLVLIRVRKIEVRIGMPAQLAMRIACFFTGHVWAVRRVNHRKHGNLAHLHPMAGKDATCKRCGKVWSDSDIERELLAEIKAMPRGAWRIPHDSLAREAIEGLASTGAVVCICDRDDTPQGTGESTIRGMGRASFGSRVRLP